MANARIDWVDRMKGILIVLVVLGHAVGHAEHFVTGLEREILHFAFKLIYMFHMPAFFLLMGLVFHDLPWREMLRRKWRRLLVPYFAFGVCSIVVFLALIGNFSSTGSTDAYYRHDYTAIPAWHLWGSLVYGAPLPGTDGFRCNNVLWFLPCLFVCNLALWGLVKVGREWLMFVVAVGCVPFYVLMNRMSCPSLPYGLSRLPELLPFSMIGFLIIRKLKFESRRWFVLPFVYLALCLFVPYDWQMFRLYGVRAEVFALGVLGTLSCCVVARGMKIGFLAKLGQASIGIMMMHKWVMLGLGWVGCHSALILTVVSVTVSYFATLMLRRYLPTVLGEGA